MRREVVKKKLSDSIIDEVKRMLEENILKEGEKLPDQLTFAKELGVSRSSLREALQRLEAMGAIKQNPKLGTVIVNGNPDRWIMEIKAPLYLDQDSPLTRELLQARRVIETAAAEIMIRTITKDEIEELRKILKKMEDAYESANITDLSLYDLDFHIFLAKCTKNRYLINMYLNIYNLLGEFFEEAFHFNPLIREQSVTWHRRILDNLEKEDKSKVPGLIAEHLLSTEKDYYQYNQQMPHMLEG